MVETLCTSTEVKFHAGKNVDSSITAGEYTTLINEAEGMICAETMVNWLDIYSSIDVDFKQVLELACATLAAISAIKNNIGSYLSTTEAQTLMDANAYKYERALARLKEAANKTFLKDGN